MAEVILMPRLSDDMSGGTIVAWHKKVGEQVKRGDLLAEIETDKATMELESYKEGTLLHIGGNKGDTINVNGLLCVIGQPGEDISKFVPRDLNNQLNNFGDQSSILSPKDASSAPIFFSYSREDSEFALKLVHDIRNRGQKIWIDISDIRPGQPWHKEVQNALKNAQTILVILSQPL